MPELTAREQQVLDRVCQGFSNKRIAAELGMSEQGAKAHVSRLFLKFGVSNRAGLATAAAQDANRALTRSNSALGLDNDRLRGENATLVDGASAGEPEDLRFR